MSFHKSESLAEVNLLAEETLQRLDSFNHTRHDYDRSATIIDQFRAQAAASPQNVAVVCESNSYTYAQVDDLSNRLACYLSLHGMKRGDTVPVFIPRSEYMVIASLGVLKAGCAYQPLDPGYPDERLAFMVKDASARFMIVDDSLVARMANFKDYSGQWLCISDILSLPEVESLEKAGVEPPQPDDLFNLIYTSGTTGVPKGVCLLHRHLMAYAAWYRRYFNPTPSTRISCYNSYGFDGFLTDVYPALTVGAAVVIITEEKKQDLPAIADIIRRHHISIADLPSQVGRQFALTMDCPSLKYIVGGGEKLIPFKPVYPYVFVNQYDPTETTVAVTCYLMTKYEEDVPIGKPMDNTAIYIVDASGRRVPPGALGELWIAGEQVSAGYLHRPEETKKAFIPNPFSREKGYETVYRTGDFVRYRPDGNIEFVGRRDGLVKIRGFRVELAEVEAVVRDYPAIRDAAVVAHANPAGGQFMAAYVVSDEAIDK
ncbi:MAG: amino acid adenylation domain-containing protein, partial [Lachnospiraceae bacterium]|nr:amino acid adenylation domain-containing protein [Lachnospiraceae bacterium]